MKVYKKKKKTLVNTISYFFLGLDVWPLFGPPETGPAAGDVAAAAG